MPGNQEKETARRICKVKRRFECINFGNAGQNLQLKSTHVFYASDVLQACMNINCVLWSKLFQVAKLKQALPVPFDIFIEQNTRVVVITGPNTGGKTICLKTVGLAAMMAKSG